MFAAVTCVHEEVELSMISTLNLMAQSAVAPLTTESSTGTAVAVPVAAISYDFAVVSLIVNALNKHLCATVTVKIDSICF